MDHFKFKEVLLSKLEYVLLEAENAFLPSTDNPKSTTSQLLDIQSEQEGFHVFAVYNNEEICSFITIWPYKEEKTIAIGPMFVREKYRSQGLGKYQVEELIKWAKNNQFRRIFTKTWRNNKASRAIFEGVGFFYIGEKLGDRMNGESTIKYFFTL